MPYTIAFLQVDSGPQWHQNRDFWIDDVVRYSGGRDGQPVGVVFYDGSYELLPANIDRNRLRALLTPDVGEVVER